MFFSFLFFFFILSFLYPLIQVEISSDYKTLYIFYNCRDETLPELANELYQIAGPLSEMISAEYFVSNIPKLKFVFDRYRSLTDQLEKLLKTADFGPNYKPKLNSEFNIPQPEDAPFRPDHPVAPHIWSLAKFDEKVASNKKPYDQSPQSAWPQCNYPSDMKLDTLGLDYKFLIDKVLFSLRRVRSTGRAFNAVADPLPPSEWSQSEPPVSFRNSNDPAYQYENRIKLMKKFIVDNRKKKLLLLREAKKLKREGYEAISERIEDAKERIEQWYQQEDEESEEHDYINYDELDMEEEREG